MAFPDKVKVKVDKENKKVYFSIQVTENQVNVHEITIGDFKKAMSQFASQIKE